MSQPLGSGNSRSHRGVIPQPARAGGGICSCPCSCSSSGVAQAPAVSRVPPPALPGTFPHRAVTAQSREPGLSESTYASERRQGHPSKPEGAIREVIEPDEWRKPALWKTLWKKPCQEADPKIVCNPFGIIATKFSATRVYSGESAILISEAKFAEKGPGSRGLLLAQYRVEVDLLQIAMESA